jgi:hypothetical protein
LATFAYKKQKFCLVDLSAYDVSLLAFTKVQTDKRTKAKARSSLAANSSAADISTLTANTAGEVSDDDDQEVARPLKRQRKSSGKDVSEISNGTELDQDSLLQASAERNILDDDDIAGEEDDQQDDGEDGEDEEEEGEEGEDDEEGDEEDDEEEMEDRVEDLGGDEDMEEEVDEALDDEDESD